MRSTHVRRAAMVGTAALLLTVPGAALTLAEPAAPAPAAPVSGLPADLVAAIQRDLGLSPDQYLARAETGQNLARFADSIRGTFPDSFAGAWLDTDGRPVVGLADGPDKAAARTAVEAAGFQVKDQQHSERTLLDQLGQLSDWLRGLPPEQSGHVKGAAIDPAANDIALRTDAAAQGQGLQLPDFLGFVRMVLGSLGSAQPPTTQPPVTTTTQPPVTTTRPPVTTTTEPPVTTTATQPPAHDAVLGGDVYNADGLASCSFGFNGTDKAGNVVNITAGHCDQDRQNAGTPDATVAYEGNFHDGSLGHPRYGTFDKTVIDNVDFSVIKIDKGVAKRFENNFVDTYGGAPLAITGTADPVEGAPVCKSGEKTGFNCGTITYINETLFVDDYRTLKGSFIADVPCALPGDSGGPLVTGTMALGISSAGDSPNQADCDTSGVTQVWATPIKAILAADPGLKVRTN
ncbi:S1 family peptidase [Nocardia stercoris]|uniref:Protease n=1 Tax=Nocardia stercoris TaxID=2483361 RepID=A0A3M2KQ80_9NOCA|nr:S1 family peptidase [Nocardia stercoris]RMI27629.1 protease [Nocardia stercoris]